MSDVIEQELRDFCAVIELSLGACVAVPQPLRLLATVVL